MTTCTPVPRPPAGQGLDSLRRSNASAVLSEIRTAESVSRSEIAANVGLSPAAVTKIIVELEGAGYLTDAAQSPPAATRGRGRPRQPITLNLERHRCVGVHVGMQRVTAGLVDLGSHVVALQSQEHGGGAPATVLSTAANLVHELVERAGVRTDDVVGYGACVGGWIPAGSGTFPVFHDQGLRHLALSDGLRVDDLPLPRVQSTVRSLGLAEARTVGGGVHNVLYVFVGNVLGCASVVDGTIASGHHDTAGLIDHISSGKRAPIPCTCGRRDCLWAAASDAALTLTAQHRGLLASGATIDDLAELSHATGAAARAARAMLEQRAVRIGNTVAALIDIHDPELVIVGGGELPVSAQGFERMVSVAHARVISGRRPTPIQPATLLGPSGLITAAATPVLDAFFADPLAPSRFRRTAA